MASKKEDVSNGEKTEEEPKVCSRDNMAACAEALGRIEDGSETWEELRLIKSMAPRAACIIPPSSHDFVSSTLLAVGAYALLIDGKLVSVFIDKLLLKLQIMDSIPFHRVYHLSSRSCLPQLQLGI